MVMQILSVFNFRKVEEGSFRFCGREVDQDAESNIMIRCKSSVENVLLINFETKGRNNNDKATQGEIGQLRSVVGSLAWVGRHCRPAIRYAVSRLQFIATAASVKDLTYANKLLQDAKADSDLGIVYKGKGFDWHNAVLVTITDASFAGEKTYRRRSRFPEKKSERTHHCVSRSRYLGFCQGQHAYHWLEIEYDQTYTSINVQRGNPIYD